MKMTDSPAAMLVTPASATELANVFELSSMRQPEMLTASAPILVSSNQSRPKGLLPLDHGATSEITTVGAAGGTSATSMSVKANAAVASGVAPTAGSSTATVTA